ncbi:MAG: GntR family transcriptional regulator, partial [Burkholderiales bacterium]|nr:GntR family transcriptional regulator [Burkholderiales bacterium]
PFAARASQPRPADKPTRRAEDTGRTVNATVYDAIKELITQSQLRPGVKLIHQDLAERLQVSRTPVREALERLFQEGLVTRLPRRGFYVAEIDEDEARELYELREALEIYALRRSLARGIRPAKLRRLDGFNRDYKALVRDGATRERMSVDRDWHLALASLAGNRALLRSLAAVFERLIMKIRTDGYRTVRGAEALHEHEQMMKALRSEDGAAAEHLLAQHIQGARWRLVSHLGELAG